MKNHKTSLLVSALAGAALLGASSAIAATVSFNVTAGNGTSAVTGTAGLVPVGNWNNGTAGNTYTNLIDDSGAATTVDITSMTAQFSAWRISATAPAVDGDGSSNKIMLNGYMNGGQNASNTVVAQIPYASYNMIVYFTSDNAGRTGTVSVGGTTYSLSTIGASSTAGSNAVLTQTTDTGTAYPTANYAIFTGLTGSDQTITTTMISNPGGGMSGFQIVQVPEPSAALLGGLGLLGLLRRRR